MININQKVVLHSIISNLFVGNDKTVGEEEVILCVKYIT